MYEVLFKMLRNQLCSRGPPPTCPSGGIGRTRLLELISCSGRSRPSDKGGPSHPDPEIRRGGGGLKKKSSSALPWAPPLDPPLSSGFARTLKVLETP